MVDIVNRKWLDNDYYGVIIKSDYQNKNFSNISGFSINKYDGNHFGIIVSINDDNFNDNVNNFNSVPISD